MRILGLLESYLFEQTIMAVILKPDASQACMGGPWTLSAPGTSECILALWQLQNSPPLPMPGGSYPLRQGPTHFPREGQYFWLCMSNVPDAVTADDMQGVLHRPAPRAPVGRWGCRWSGSWASPGRNGGKAFHSKAMSAY